MDWVCFDRCILNKNHILLNTLTPFDLSVACFFGTPLEQAKQTLTFIFQISALEATGCSSLISNQLFGLGNWYAIGSWSMQYSNEYANKYAIFHFLF
jgi:hypothetical protein